MHIHILGICGTFMGGVARIAVEQGYKVTGSDIGVYPPMSDQLQELGIEIFTGWDVSQFNKKPDLVVIGNALSRGNSAVEYVLNNNLDYCSGPEFIFQHVLKKKWVLAVSGTHGKTTTTSMLAWILDYAGMKPGFLIGGVAENFGISSRLGQSEFFVIEADEYDTAFFDKRSKFVHYHPRTLVINNLEFDHADIFSSLEDIQKQFNHLIRTVPGNGKIVFSRDYSAISATLEKGCWSETESYTLKNDKASNWTLSNNTKSYSAFDVCLDGNVLGHLQWNLIGQHNAANAVVSIAAARHAGVSPSTAIEALATFKSVKRRLEKIGTFNGISVYDDFAHHPTAIRLTVDALRAAVTDEKILAIIEPRSNTMKMGIHKSDLADSLTPADAIISFDPGNLEWSLEDALSPLKNKIRIFDQVEDIVQTVQKETANYDHILIMSNGSFQGLYKKLCAALQGA
jgi:UDP-N-acetylmuramate: L-alanyl-gamma-D-glutamyl-meso-diaminopimelate ligase